MQRTHVGLSDKQDRTGRPQRAVRALAVEPLLRRHVEEVGGVVGAAERLAQVPVLVVRVGGIHVVVQGSSRREGAQETPHKDNTEQHPSPRPTGNLGQCYS